MKTIQLQLPESLLLHTGQSLADLERRSQVLLALKYFELGQLSSGQAAEMCGMTRATFLTEASLLGVPAADLSPEEMQEEFGHA
jgi:predicted HTH domain antitoxin